MLIGLTGTAGSGKDTVYAMLDELYGDEILVERVSPADLLYDSAAAALGVRTTDLEHWKRQDVWIQVYDRSRPGLLAAQTVRSFLQRYGTEAHRDIFGQDFWVKALTPSLVGHDGIIMAVTGVRFPNEARAVREAGGVVVRVLGPETGLPPHASEESLPDDLVDFTVDNTVRDDNFARLRHRVGNLASYIWTLETP